MKIELDLTKDEWLVLCYLVRDLDPNWGNPLKDCIRPNYTPVPYSALSTLQKKLVKCA